ncbi:MAG: radical SAM protein [Desulfosalsimonadaceae bacterium]
MCMRVLFISPNTETINMPVLPLGMASVVASTRKAGHTVLSLNLLESSDIRMSFENAFREIKPDAIGISVRNIDDQSMENTRFLLDPVKELVEDCRKMSDAPVILGGAGYSIFPQSTLEYTGADFGLQGEGEEMFPLLLEFLNAGRKPLCIPGVYSRKMKRNNPPRYNTDLDLFPLPEPDVHLDIPGTIDKGQLWLPYQTRRGCPMKCNYCSTPVIEGTTLRFHDIRAIIENLSLYVENGITQFFFVDNIFNIPEPYAEQLCDALIESGFVIQWRCILYPRKINPELAGKMTAAGCAAVSLGFESGAVPVLAHMNKQFTPPDISETCRILNDCGIEQQGFLLLGGPGETRQTVEESLAFADSLPLDTLKITVGIRIYPETPLAKTALAEGVISDGDDLLNPRFYLRPELAGWLPAYTAAWAGERPHCQI